MPQLYVLNQAASHRQLAMSGTLKSNHNHELKRVKVTHVVPELVVELVSAPDNLLEEAVLLLLLLLLVEGGVATQQDVGDHTTAPEILGPRGTRLGDHLEGETS